VHSSAVENRFSPFWVDSDHGADDRRGYIILSAASDPKLLDVEKDKIAGTHLINASKQINSAAGRSISHGNETGFAEAGRQGCTGFLHAPGGQRKKTCMLFSAADGIGLTGVSKQSCD
jgi:hypothetical protein